MTDVVAGQREGVKSDRGCQSEQSSIVDLGDEVAVEREENERGQVAQANVLQRIDAVVVEEQLLQIVEAAQFHLQKRSLIRTANGSNST